MLGFLHKTQYEWVVDVYGTDKLTKGGLDRLRSLLCFDVGGG